MSFEVMAGDLWESVVNEHPYKLAALSGKLKGWEAGKAEQAKPEAGKSQKTISLGLLERCRYNLLHEKGTILREEKCDFSSLWGIRGAYARAFCEDQEIIAKILTDKNLEAGAKMRNVIVHRGGRVDQDFKDASNALPMLNRYKDVPMGEHIEVDGDIVCQLSA